MTHHPQHIPTEDTAPQPTTQRGQWFQHLVQVVMIGAIIGVPLFVWGSSINAQFATSQAQISYITSEIAELKADRALVTSQLAQANAQLSGIAAQVRDIRDDWSSRKR